MTARHQLFDPLLEPSQADAIVALCENFGSYGSYAEEATNQVAFAPELPQRFDAAYNFVRTGGRFSRQEDVAVLAARTNYFRETYAYDGETHPGVEPILNHPGLIEAAGKLYDCGVVVPNIVYANMLVPGQELPLHTDVPEFRGANRKRYPQWLMVVMHHSGLFASHRRRIATGITYFGPSDGGELAYYPDGPEGAPRTLEARHNTGILLDTDSVFHGVDRVTETQPIPALRPGLPLSFEGDAMWRVGPADAALARYRWDELRFSVSWKAYCYRDQAERELTESGGDDLDLDHILSALRADLRQRGSLGAESPSERELAQLLVSEYISFPEPAE